MVAPSYLTMPRRTGAGLYRFAARYRVTLRVVDQLTYANACKIHYNARKCDENDDDTCDSTAADAHVCFFIQRTRIIRYRGRRVELS